MENFIFCAVLIDSNHMQLNSVLVQKEYHAFPMEQTQGITVLGR